MELAKALGEDVVNHNQHLQFTTFRRICQDRKENFMELTFEEKLTEISCKVERLGTTAWAAASASFRPEKSEEILDAVLYSIKSLSEQIASELDKIIVDYFDK